MPNCTKCGAAVRKDSSFCAKCGTHLSQSVVVAENNVTFSTVPNVSASSTSNFTLWFILSILFCWPMAIAGYVEKRRADVAQTPEEAQYHYVKAAKRCKIGLVITGTLFIIAFAFGR